MCFQWSLTKDPLNYDTTLNISPHCWEDAGVGGNNALSFKEMPQDVGIIWIWQAAPKAFAVCLPWDWLPLAVVTSSLSYLFFSIINTGAKVWN